jgi:hypothetical protein
MIHFPNFSPDIFFLAGVVPPQLLSCFKAKPVFALAAEKIARFKRCSLQAGETA